MPISKYSPKQQNLIRAIAHGFKPTRAMKNVSKEQALEMGGGTKSKARRDAVSGK